MGSDLQNRGLQAADYADQPRAGRQYSDYASKTSRYRIDGELSTGRDSGSSFSCKAAISAASTVPTPIRSTPAGESPRLRKRSCAWPQTRNRSSDGAGGVTFSGGEPTFQATALAPASCGSCTGRASTLCLDGRTAASGTRRSRSCWGWSTWCCSTSSRPTRSATARSRDATTRRRCARRHGSRNTGKPFWLRDVLVPGYSDAEADIRALGERLGGYKQVERVEILPYTLDGRSQIRSNGQRVQARRRTGDTPRNSRNVPRRFSAYISRRSS